MTARELHDLRARNANILNSPGATTSTYVRRISVEQSAIDRRLLELEGVDSIQAGLRNTKIAGVDDMNVDLPLELPVSRTLLAKQKALLQFTPNNGTGATGCLNLEEAVELEQRTHALDEERKQRSIEKKKRLGLPISGEVLTRQEREARIWAFMNHKPTDSDLEDDDDDVDADDEDPASWFEDDQDDGRKGQDIVEPDAEVLADIIRIDHNNLHYSTFYEPR
jgi:hypothetical protein